MDTDRRETLSSRLHGGSRRGVLAALTGGSLAALGALRGQDDAQAKKKHKKKHKKAPSLALAYQCPAPAESFGTYNTISRVAQVFVAGRGGTLRRIEFRIDKGDFDAGDYVVQLLRVDDGTPSHLATHILAGITIPDAGVPQGESTLTANFNGPELAAGMEYAAAIGRVGSSVTLGYFSGTGNVCAGQLFVAQGIVFSEATGQDIVTSVFVD